jgi:hypothetical protein
MDPTRNGSICNLCKAPYIFLVKQIFEEIPNENTLLYFSLRHPYLPFLTVHYIWVFHQALLKDSHDPFDTTFFPYYQALFHLVYFGLYLAHVQIKHKDRYWSLWRTQSLSFNISFHGVTLYVMFHGFPLVSLALIYILGFYWRHHVKILQEINREAMN